MVVTAVLLISLLHHTLKCLHHLLCSNSSHALHQHYANISTYLKWCECFLPVTGAQGITSPDELPVCTISHSSDHKLLHTVKHFGARNNLPTSLTKYWINHQSIKCNTSNCNLCQPSNVQITGFCRNAIHYTHYTYGWLQVSDSSHKNTFHVLSWYRSLKHTWWWVDIFVRNIHIADIQTNKCTCLHILDRSCFLNRSTKKQKLRPQVRQAW